MYTKYIDLALENRRATINLSAYSFIPKFQSKQEDGFHLRVLVGRGDGPVDVDHQSGVVGRVGTGEGDLVGRVGVAAAGDGDLSAGNVELSLAWSRVQTNVFDTEEVVSAEDARRQRDLSLVQVLMRDGTLVSICLGPRRAVGRYFSDYYSLMLGHVSCEPKFGCSW